MSFFGFWFSPCALPISRQRAATLNDIRAEVLSPERLNAMVSGGFAGVALLIAIVGVAGVLAFSVSGRTREFGIRLAIGSQPSAPEAAWNVAATTSDCPMSTDVAVAPADVALVP